MKFLVAGLIAFPGIRHVGTLSLSLGTLEQNKALVSVISNTCAFPTMTITEKIQISYETRISKLSINTKHAMIA